MVPLQIIHFCIMFELKISSDPPSAWINALAREKDRLNIHDTILPIRKLWHQNHH